MTNEEEEYFRNMLSLVCGGCIYCWNAKKCKECLFSKISEQAIEALKKQIPKKPIPQDEDCLECPNCDSFIGYASECQDEHYRVDYCPNCGQAIDWSEET